jgi:hypothetical protein
MYYDNAINSFGVKYKKVLRDTTLTQREQEVKLGDLKGRWAISGPARLIIYTTPQNRSKTMVHYSERTQSGFNRVLSRGLGKNKDTLINHNSNQKALYKLMLKGFQGGQQFEVILQLLMFLDTIENKAFMYDFGKNLYLSIIAHLKKVPGIYSIFGKDTYIKFTPINENTLQILSIVAHLLNTDMTIINPISQELLDLLTFLESLGITETGYSNILQRKIF